MRVVCLVAGIAVLWASTVLASGVALHAGYLVVLSLQRIRRRAMVERGPLPALECMALCAILA